MQQVFSNSPFPGKFQYEFLDVIFLVLPKYCLEPGLLSPFRMSGSHGGAPYDENEFASSIRGGACLHFLSSIPAYSSQIALRTMSDSFAPREVISHLIALQRVLTKPLLLRLLYLLVTEGVPKRS